MKKIITKRTNGVCEECGSKVATIRVVELCDKYIVANVCCGCNTVHKQITSPVSTREEAVYTMDKALQDDSRVKELATKAYSKVHDSLCKAKNGLGMVAGKVKDVHLGTKLKSISSRLPRVKVSVVMPEKREKVIK